MTNRLQFILPLLLFVALLLFFWCGLGKDPTILPAMRLNQPLPTFAFPALENDHVITNEDFKGHLTLLTIWASWCPACELETPLLIDLARQRRVVLYGLNYKDDREAAEKFLSKRGNPFKKSIFDPEGKLAILLGVYGTPETFLIDATGVIRHRYVGPITLDLVTEDILPRLKRIEEGK